MSDYVYLNIKLYLEEGQTEDTIQEIIQEMDYSFDHPQIIEHEIMDITDTHIGPRETDGGEGKYIDLFDMEHAYQDLE